MRLNCAQLLCSRVASMRVVPVSRRFTNNQGCSRSLVPAQARTTAVLGDPAFEEILLLAEVDRLAHPGEGIARGSISRDQRTIIVVEDRCQRTGVLQQVCGAIRDEIFADAIEQRHGMELGGTPARVEDAIR
jgi:hypothetical protein